jgi:hypothetical protein
LLLPVLPALQDKYHLYFLFDLMSGGDLMDVLVSEAQVIKMRVAQGALKRGCFAPQVRLWRCGREGPAKQGGRGKGVARVGAARAGAESQ